MAFLLLGLPLAFALAAMVKTSVNIPLGDNYGAIALFLYRYVHTPGWPARVGWILTSQFTQYKLLFLNIVVVLQYHLFGHTNFRALQLLGDLFVFAALWLLWLFLARQQRPFQQALWLILPPWYLFLSLCFVESVNWAISSFFSFAIGPLALACIFFFTSSIRYASLWGTLFLILSIFTNPSGFMLGVALLILLIHQRRLGASLTVALATAAAAALYWVHYTVLSAHYPLSQHVGGLFVFGFAFLGGILPTPFTSTVLGVVLVAGFIFLLTRGWARLSPDTFCIGLFCLLTAVLVSPGRIHEGVESAISSRYQVFPLMLLSAEYLAVLRIFVPRRLELRSVWAGVIGLATLAAIAFGIPSQMHAYRVMHLRQRLLLTHLILWERHPERVVLIPDEPPYLSGPRWLANRIAAQKVLQQSIASGLYIPPASAQEPLPMKPRSDSTLGIEDESWPPNAAVSNPTGGSRQRPRASDPP